ACRARHRLFRAIGFSVSTACSRFAEGDANRLAGRDLVKPIGVDGRGIRVHASSSHPRGTSMSRSVRSILVLGVFLSSVSSSWSQELTLDSLRCMDRCALDEVFRNGRTVCLPTGYARGHILYFSECYYRCPKLAAAMSGAAWKGKHFACDGTFVNQFAA